MQPQETVFGASTEAPLEGSATKYLPPPDTDDKEIPAEAVPPVPVLALPPKLKDVGSGSETETEDSDDDKRKDYVKLKHSTGDQSKPRPRRARKPAQKEEPVVYAKISPKKTKSHSAPLAGEFTHTL